MGRRLCRGGGERERGRWSHTKQLLRALYVCSSLDNNYYYSQCTWVGHHPTNAFSILAHVWATYFWSSCMCIRSPSNDTIVAHVLSQPSVQLVGHVFFFFPDHSSYSLRVVRGVLVIVFVLPLSEYMLLCVGGSGFIQCASLDFVGWILWPRNDFTYVFTIHSRISGNSAHCQKAK